MGGEMRAAQADAVAAMASKVERGAVRPDNLRMLPAGFFEPGHAYTHRPGPDDLGGPRLRFYCESVTTDKATGQPIARGWGGRRYGDRRTSVQQARRLDDWPSGAWVDTTAGGYAPGTPRPTPRGLPATPPAPATSPRPRPAPPAPAAH